MLVTGVVDGSIGSASSVASWLNLDDGIALWESVAVDVMGTLGHGVVVAEGTIAIVSSSNDTGVGEPIPWSSNLTSIASE